MTMKKVTADSLIEALEIVNENVQIEAMRQPGLFVDAARYRVEKMRERAVVSAELDAWRAHLAMTTRNKKGKKGEKITEGALKELLELSPRNKRLRGESDRAYEHEELSKLILEAYRQRMSALKIIAEAQVFEGMREGSEIERQEQSRKLRNTARKLLDKRRSITSEL